MGKRCYLLLVLFVAAGSLQSQSLLGRKLPHQGVSLQFAGSVGFLSAGYYRRTEKEKIELSLIYGHTPRVFGGPLHSVSFKFLYSPFRIGFLHRFSFEPLQAGIFIAQNFGRNLYVTWPDKYPSHYYWWPNSLREHVFASSQVSFSPTHTAFEKISAYFEANTNDLYIYSWAPNRGAITLYDIIFFGIGIKAGIR